ncbi:3-phosphoglycerate dehydrogenase [Basidiobolus meristosporus CBS 931.73]|uniref:3-phosphoglycerate dehydrogenase n=1 Tax=Basidiobolus meristosporus CBS 931.73 TaxID=1314790 RepID=A0A1Y1YSJ7_9FUNG|nr:3-phosphoglycerate dehydrogenase [Basidiobolus meristosporus CBS 931.73]|eukprot:ORY00998.1 3-phosphoglycerate dehydrogenase [Basidiobolus meristosporus CBS 931.73]
MLSDSFTQHFQNNTTQFKQLRPLNSGDIKILLLENVNTAAVEMLTKQGYQVEHHTKALPEDVLIEKIRDVSAIGIRSKTKLSAKILKEAKKLLVIGCFCIGTNQVDLDAATKQGIAVFNSPFSNSRSVAEMVISNIIALARQFGDRNREMHQGVWNKVSANCYEIRGKKLGIVGYGHIGSQLSVLAESMGMQVIFYDVLQLMPLGTARNCSSLNELLESADFVTLHVPETPETKNMIGKQELARMRKGSYLINASRGTVVDLPELAAALKSGHLSGSAVDVFPQEPRANGEGFTNVLQGCPNTILSPHIGGSTEEAQSMIGVEVASAIIKYVNYGTSLGAVNFPQVDLRAISANESKIIRVIHTHHNVPGVLKQVNNILANHNVEKQICDSTGDIAYLMADLTISEGEEDLHRLYERVAATPETIMTRVLY